LWNYILPVCSWKTDSNLAVSSQICKFKEYQPLVHSDDKLHNKLSLFYSCNNIQVVFHGRHTSSSQWMCISTILPANGHQKLSLSFAGSALQCWKAQESYLLVSKQLDTRQEFIKVPLTSI